MRPDAPAFVPSALRSFELEGAMVIFGIGVEITSIKLSSERTGQFGNWVQTNTVTASWFKPSRMAFLSYSDRTALEHAAELLLTRPTPSGRILACTVTPPRPNDTSINFTLQVRNLDIYCTTEWLESVLSSEQPLKIKLREPPHTLDENETNTRVEGLLLSIGDIESSNFHNNPKSMKLYCTVEPPSTIHRKRSRLSRN